MKKIKLILVVGLVLMTSFTFGQETPAGDEEVPSDAASEKRPIGERKLTFCIGGGYNHREYGYWNLGLNIQNLPTSIVMFQRVGAEFIFAGNSNLGASIFLSPLNKNWGRVKFYLDEGIVFHNRNGVFAPHDSLVSRTVGDAGKLVLALRLGCRLEFFDRFGVFATYNPGISWYPTSEFTWGNNGDWYWGGQFGIYVLYGGLKKVRS